MAESSLCVPATLPGPTSTGGSVQTQRAVSHGTAHGARGHTLTPAAAPTPTEGQGSFYRADGPERASLQPALCCPGGRAALPRWRLGGRRTGLIQESGTQAQPPSEMAPLTLAQPHPCSKLNEKTSIPPSRIPQLPALRFPSSPGPSRSTPAGAHLLGLWPGLQRGLKTGSC